ncbi:GntR family transcriptional regulator [Mesorhizobium sp. ASY16-5R]|uniref:GntR family transcriptional regulator n=1 Tax=Mesorhizobium sp. ASY16-5R TaxID=3445772 RepID=UPI003FA13751
MMPQRNSLSQQVYDHLRLGIMAGRFLPGTRLSISGLAEEFGTSPTPVREAIFQLVREHALELRPGHQPRVPALDIQHYVEVREVRAPLERLAAELAASRISQDEIDELAGLHRRYAECEDAQDWTEALAANQSFHFCIYRASGNETLRAVLENFWLVTGPFVANQYPAILNSRITPHPHNQLIDALRRRNAQEAGDALVNDLRDGSHQLLEWLRRKEAGTSAPVRSRSTDSHLKKGLPSD